MILKNQKMQWMALVKPEIYVIFAAYIILALHESQKNSAVFPKEFVGRF